MQPPTDTQLVDLDDDSRHRQLLGVKRRAVTSGPFKQKAMDEPAVKALLSLEAQTGRRLHGVSLFDIEQAKVELWGARLLRIIFRAKAELESRGEFLPLITEVKESTETTAEALVLLKKTAQLGAWRTIRGHVYAFGRLEAFVRAHGRPGESVYPCKASTLVRYLMSLSDVGIKPTVPGTLKGSVIWVHKRLQLPYAQILNTPLVDTISASIAEARSTHLNEKSVMRVDDVAAIERLVGKAGPVIALFAGLFLIMLYATVRFDDVLHSAADVIELVDGALLGVSWQTKVDRR
ncbi:MAG: hypothetical protein VX747_07300, partial [Actinomycetota bacterium]|nr:hypothetical protein [Actinomycetota bacterium]